MPDPVFLITGTPASARSGLPRGDTRPLAQMGEAARQELNGTGVRVTLIEPGMVRTPFFESPPPDALKPDDIARAVMYAVGQPPHLDVNEILMRPVAQGL
jgi:NADP-dependent 3-hydroxy acid dehydrogenase YdfG